VTAPMIDKGAEASLWDWGGRVDEAEGQQLGPELARHLASEEVAVALDLLGRPDAEAQCADRRVRRHEGHRGGG